MMNQQPDKIFRDKLNNLQRPAPAAAWDRIETNLKKNDAKSGWWWKAAASLLLLATAAYILWPAESSNSPLTKVTEQNQVTASEANKDTNTIASSSIKKDSATVETEPKEKFVATRKAAVKQKPIRKSAPEKRQSALTLDEVILADLNSEQLNNVKHIDEQIESTPVVSSKPKGLKLQFSAEETSKYLDTNAVAEATSEGKKSSTFKKLLMKANDLKSNQDPFGDLREKKNEILALNFKSEKRGQNK